MVLWVSFSLYFAQPFFLPPSPLPLLLRPLPLLFPIAVVFFFFGPPSSYIFASRSLVACVLFLAVVFKIIFITFFFLGADFGLQFFLFVGGGGFVICVRACVGGRTGVFLFSFVLVFCLSLFCVCASLCVCVCGRGRSAGYVENQFCFLPRILLMRFFFLLLRSSRINPCDDFFLFMCLVGFRAIVSK